MNKTLQARLGKTLGIFREKRKGRLRKKYEIFISNMLAFQRVLGSSENILGNIRRQIQKKGG